jgi:Zn-dependent protease with chaperone function
VKRLVLLGMVGAVAVGCLFGATAPSCWHGVACLAAVQPFDLLRAALFGVIAGGFMVALRAGWSTLRLARALRGLPRAGHRPELGRHRVECITSFTPQAFCAGALRPRVYVTDSLVELLNPPSLAAVIAHEQAHARRRDPLRRSLLAAVSDLLLNAPWVLWLRRRHGEQAEISADRSAAILVGPSAVADALTALAIGGENVSTDSASVDPVSTSGLRPILVSAAATLAVAVMLLCLSQAVLLLGSGQFLHL